MTPWSLTVMINDFEKMGCLMEIFLQDRKKKKKSCCPKHILQLKNERLIANLSAINAFVLLRIPFWML